MTTLSLTGLSGKSYAFTVFNATGVEWNPVGGVYAFADQNGRPKYIGQTENFQSRNPGPDHESWPKAASHGASIILAMAIPGSNALVRTAAEADLIRAYDPPANTQMRLAAALLRETPQARFGHGLPLPRKTILGG